MHPTFRAGYHLLFLIALLLPAPSFADVGSRLLQLVAIPGVSGYEQAVREYIELALPPNACVRADNMGNIVLRTGNGTPHTLVVAPLHESGLVVSAITADGYLRAHRHTTAPAARLATQYLIGQAVEIRMPAGRIVPGVAEGQSVTVRKRFVPLGGSRATGRAMDDRGVGGGILIRPV